MNSLKIFANNVYQKIFPVSEKRVIIIGMNNTGKKSKSQFSFTHF